MVPKESGLNQSETFQNSQLRDIMRPFLPFLSPNTPFYWSVDQRKGVSRKPQSRALSNNQIPCRDLRPTKTNVRAFDPIIQLTNTTKNTHGGR